MRQSRAHRRALAHVVGVLDESEVFEMAVDLVGDAQGVVGGTVVDHDDLGGLGPQGLEGRTEAFESRGEA